MLYKLFHPAVAIIQLPAYPYFRIYRHHAKDFPDFSLSTQYKIICVIE